MTPQSFEANAGTSEPGVMACQSHRHLQSDEVTELSTTHKTLLEYSKAGF
jgi:uncharacterized cupin superfamily protein